MARILILDDDFGASHELSTMLASMGHKTVIATHDAQRAMVVAEDERPEIAMVSINLRGPRDGITVAGHLRDMLPIKVIFLSHTADRETVNRASAVKPLGYLLKPFTEDTVFACLSVALARETADTLPVDFKKLSEESVGVSRLPNATLEMITDYILKTLDQEISLKTLAEIARMSESSFSRRFKSTTGISPYQFVVQERIEEAKRLLRDTDWSLADIAIAVGFSSQSHFSTAFKKAVKLTPMSYRRL
ncbi:MAG: DNA-binding response regulator [Pseudomonadota bacterium]